MGQQKKTPSNIYYEAFQYRKILYVRSILHFHLVYPLSRCIVMTGQAYVSSKHMRCKNVQCHQRQILCNILNRFRIDNSQNKMITEERIFSKLWLKWLKYLRFYLAANLWPENRFLAALCVSSLHFGVKAMAQLGVLMDSLHHSCKMNVELSDVTPLCGCKLQCKVLIELAWCDWVIGS